MIPVKKIPLIRACPFKLLMGSILIFKLTNASILQAKEMPTTSKALLQAQEYYLRGNYNRAILLLNNLLPNSQPENSVTIRSNLAEIYRHLGQHGKAIAQWKEAIEIVSTQNDYSQKSQLSTLSKLQVDLARSHIHLGQASRAIPLLEEALKLAKQADETRVKNVAQRALGNAYQIAGEYDKAIAVYTNSLKKTQNLETRIRTINGLVDVYQLRSKQYLINAEGAVLEKNNDLFDKYDRLAKADKAKAQNYAELAMNLSKNSFSLPTARALLNLSLLSPQQNTAANTKRILSITEELSASRSKVYLLISLAKLKPQQATGILNQAVETASILQDKRALSFAWGALGNVYEQKGSLKQALFWTQKAELAAQEVFATDSLYQWQWQAGRIYRAMKADEEARDAYRGAIASIQNIRNDLLNAEKKLQLDFRSQVEPVYREFLSLLLKNGDRDGIKEALATADLLQLSQLQSFFGDDCLAVKLDSFPNKVLERMDTAIIRSIILENQTYLILRLPNGTTKSYRVAIEAKQLQKQIDDWRYSLEDLSSEGYLPQSQFLYNLLIRPLAKDLAASDSTKIIFINDGRLRNVPMAALHDGQQFLIEKYATSYSLGLNVVARRRMNSDKLKALAFGLTVPKNGFPALNNVRQEIEDLAKLVDSREFLDRDFTQENFQQQLEHGYSIVHLATHAQFGGSSNNAFIQAFDREISLTELEMILSKLQQPIELLVLSACQTAAGNSRSVLGLAGIATRANVNTVVGSLWAVNDAQTVGLMEDFYRDLSLESLNESEALRTAQLKQISQPLGHPGVWSSFVAIE